MTKITHKGLWFEYSSLSKEDKKLTKKVLLSAILCGFFIGLSFDKSSIIMWSEILHPSLYYGLPLTVLITGFLLLNTLINYIKVRMSYIKNIMIFH